MSVAKEDMPWLSFCMSTYKRPELLRNALVAISQQSFSNIEVIISDNDPAKSAEAIVSALNDP